MIVTIDGPAGAGKSSAARGLAQRLGYDYLDTGAMYRCVALAGVRAQVDWQHPEQLTALAAQLHIDLTGNRVLLDGQDVTAEIRSPEITRLVQHAAGNNEIRRLLVLQQKRFGEGRNLVTEGRDQGTVVFPHAECKIFLTASPDERARRRHAELMAKGENISLSQVESQQKLRDDQDEQREYGGMRMAPGAVPISTTGLTLEQVIDRLEQEVRSAEQRGAAASSATPASSPSARDEQGAS